MLARRGAKFVYEIGGGSGREYITVLGCGSADGIKVPPFVVYEGKNLWERWTRGGLAAARYGVSDSGWRQTVSMTGSNVFLYHQCPISWHPVQFCFL